MFLRQRRDPLDLDARAELDLVARDRRAAHEAGDLRVDAELLHDLGQRRDDVVVRLGGGLVRRPGLEHLALGQRVGAPTRDRELLRLAGGGVLRDDDGLVARRVPGRDGLGEQWLGLMHVEQVMRRVVARDARHQDGGGPVLVLQHGGVLVVVDRVLERAGLDASRPRRRRQWPRGASSDAAAARRGAPGPPPRAPPCATPRARTRWTSPSGPSRRRPAAASARGRPRSDRRPRRSERWRSSR